MGSHSQIVPLRRFFADVQQSHLRIGNAQNILAVNRSHHGKLFEDLGVPPLDPAVDRGMICGSMDMIKDTKALLEKAGLTEGANNKPAEFVVERAFVG